jgi:hypothetical protein
MLAEPPGGERLVGAAQLGPRQRHGPRRGLDGDVAVAVARPGAGPVAAGVSFPAEELGDLSLQRGLQDQPGAQASDVLDDLAEVTVTVSEQGVVLGTDAVSGR